MSSKQFYASHVFVCVNQRDTDRPCCAQQGAKDLQSYMKQRCKELGLRELRINQSLCLNRCELGPVMVIYPEGVWYKYNSKEDIDKIIEQHLVKNQIVSELQLNNNQ